MLTTRPDFFVQAGGSLRTLVLVLLGCLAANRLPAQTAAIPPAQDQMTSMSTLYDEACQELKNRAAQPLEQVKNEYLLALARVNRTYTDLRDADSLRVVKREEDRMRAQSTLPAEALVDWPDKLRNLQLQYLEKFDTTLYPYCEKLVRLHDTFGSMLERLVNQDGSLMADADGLLAVAAADPLMIFAQGVCGRMEQDGSDEPGEGGADAAELPPGRAPAVPESEARFYASGDEPAKTVKAFNLQHTGRQSRAAIGFVDAEIGVYTDTAALESTHGSGWSRREGAVRYVPRISIKCLSSAGLQNAVVSISYVSRDLYGSMRSDRKTAMVENIPLPAMRAGDQRILDAAGLALHRSENGTGEGQYNHGKGRELFGLVVSVFNPQGTLLFQRATHSSLESYASATLLPAGKP